MVCLLLHPLVILASDLSAQSVLMDFGTTLTINPTNGLTWNNYTNNTFQNLVTSQSNSTSYWPDLPVVFIDTGYHFPETLTFARELTQQLRLNLKTYRPLLTPAEIESRHGKLWEQGPEGLEKFHEIIRVEPMRQAFRDLQPALWLAGLRRSVS